MLINQILRALVEVFTVYSSENHAHAMIMPEQQQLFGDNNRFFSMKKENVKSVRPE